MKKYLFIEAVSDGFGDLHVRLNPLDGVKYREVSLADIEKESFVARNEDIKIKICISDESADSAESPKEELSSISERIPELQDMMLFVKGLPFVCSCAGNLFRRPVRENRKLYECKSCFKWYESDESDEEDKNDKAR